MFGFGSMSPFFHDEYLFGDDQRPRQRREGRNRCNQDVSFTELTTRYRECLDCGYELEIGFTDTSVTCPNCGGRFNVSR